MNAQHIIVVRYRLDGIPSYRPFGACECGWEGPLRTSYAEAEMDSRWHRVSIFQRQHAG